MNKEKIYTVAYLGLKTNLGVRQICDALKKAMLLEEFQVSSDAECETGVVLHAEFELKIIKPFDKKIISAWQWHLPELCNCGITITLPRGSKLVRDIEFAEGYVYVLSQLIVDALKTPIFFSHYSNKELKQKFNVVKEMTAGEE